MKAITVKNFLIITLITICFLGINQTQAQTTKTVKTSSKTDKVSETQKEAIENIVRDYLLKNPEIIREAMQALQTKEAREKQELAAKNLRKFEKEIFNDPNTPTAGNDKAEVSIVAFFDYNCGYCKQSLPVLKELLEKDASIRIVYKEFPILSQSSQLAAKAALAADKQGKYLEFHNALVQIPEINEETIKEISNQLKMNYVQLQKDMSSPTLNEALNRNYRLANALGVDGTPAYIIGERIYPGALDIATLESLVKAEREKLHDKKSIGKNLKSKE